MDAFSLELNPLDIDDDTKLVNQAADIKNTLVLNSQSRCIHEHRLIIEDNDDDDDLLGCSFSVSPLFDNLKGDALLPGESLVEYSIAGGSQ